MDTLKGKIPRSGLISGRAFRRAPILDGTIPTYYGPGQDQTMVREYNPPTDWARAGSLLRCPQVVWLVQAAQRDPRFSSVTQTEGYLWTSFERGPGDPGHYPEFNLDPFSAFYNNPADREAGLALDGGIFSDFFSPGPGIPFEPMVFRRNVAVFDEHVYDDPSDATEARLLGVFAEVKARIEALRPGKTWVEPFNWQTTNPDLDDFYGYSIPNFNYAPAVPVDGAVGCDTLFIGATDGAIFSQTEEAEWLLDFEGRFVPPAWVESLKRLPRFAMRMHHPDPALWPDLSEAPVPPDGPPLYYRAISARQACEGAGSNFDLQAGEENGIEMTHPGTASLLTADDLIRQIADHFGFDPDTGQPLPAA